MVRPSSMFYKYFKQFSRIFVQLYDGVDTQKETRRSRLLIETQKMVPLESYAKQPPNYGHFSNNQIRVARLIYDSCWHNNIFCVNGSGHLLLHHTVQRIKIIYEFEF